MGFLKKLIIIVGCALVMQLASAMHKVPFKSVFKNYAYKTKSVVNKRLLHSLKPKKVDFENWKKWATLGAIAGASYGLWNGYENIFAKSDIQEDWDKLSQKEKDALAAKYAKANVTEAEFEKASSYEKDRAIHAIINKLKQGQPVPDFVIFYYYSDNAQKNLLAQAFADYIKQKQGFDTLSFKDIKNSNSYSIGAGALHLMFTYSTKTQIDLIIPALVELVRLKKDSTNKLLENAYFHVQEPYRQQIAYAIAQNMQEGEAIEVLVPNARSSVYAHVIAERLKQGHDIQNLEMIYDYVYSDSKHIIASGIAELLKQGRTVENLEGICKAAYLDDFKILASGIAQALQQGYDIQNLDRIYAESLKESKQILTAAIVELLKQGRDVQNLDAIYKDSYGDHKQIFSVGIAEALKQGHHIKNIDTIYKAAYSDERQILASGIAEALKRGHAIQNVYSIYTAAANYDEQRKILVSGIAQALMQGQDIQHIDLIYEAASEDEQQILVVGIVEQLKQGHTIPNIDGIYRKSFNVTKKIIAMSLAEAFIHGQTVEFLLPVMDYYSNFDPGQKKRIAPMIFSKVLELSLDDFSNTQTLGHMMHNLVSVISGRTMRCYIQDPNLVAWFKKVLVSEQELLKQDYAVFYHAQIWDIYWLELVYTKLWEIKHEQSLDDYTFTRFPQDGSCFQNRNLLLDQEVIRKELLRRGRFDPYRPSLLFLNYAVHGNSTNPGSSSFDYFIENSNVSKPDITTETIFELFGLKDFYIQHKDVIDAAEKQFSELSTKGNMLQIAIQKKYLEKYIYLSTSGGPKIKTSLTKQNLGYGYNDSGEIVEKTEEHITTTDNVQGILEILKMNPEEIQNSDKKEFVLVDTFDTVQKAAVEKFLKIKSFNMADPEKLETVTTEFFNNFLAKELAGRWKNEPTPWECVQRYKAKKRKNW